MKTPATPAIFKFEHKSQPLAPRPKWRRRIGISIALAGAIISIALTIGILGYHFIAALPWIDALVEAAMILSGMGPISALSGNAAKVFAAFYALFSGLVFIGTASILVAPWIHRVLHRLHVELDERSSDR